MGFGNSEKSWNCLLTLSKAADSQTMFVTPRKSGKFLYTTFLFILLCLFYYPA